MSNVNGGTVTVRVEGKDVGLTELLTRINRQMATSGQNARTYATQMAAIDPVAKKTDQALAKYAQTLAAVAKAQGDTAGSQKLLIAGLQGITPATTAANQVMLQLQNNINQQANAAKSSVSQWDSMAKGLTSLVGAYAVATTVVKGFADVINQGNQLEKTLTTFRVLSGSQQQYQNNLAEAKAQQDLFGGSLQDTVEGMSSFANLSNRTGIEITKLTNLARALAIIDPAQGFKGAGIALKEFFSGDITSLARRFEIPREALNNIKNIADESERFAALSNVLSQYGINVELLAAQSQTTSTAFAKLTGQASDAAANVGTLIAQLSRPFVETLSTQIDNMNNGFDKLFALFNQGDKIADFQQRVFGAESTGTFDQYLAKINEVNAQLPVFAQKLEPLTAAQFAFAQSLIATGSSAEEAFAKVAAFSPIMQELNNLFENNATFAVATAAAQDTYAASTLRAAASNANGAVFARAVADAVAAGRIPVEQGAIALDQYSAAMEANALAAAAEKAALDLTAQATQLFTQDLVINSLEQINNKIQSDALKITQEQLYSAALAAAQGMGATASSAAALAGQFNITTGEAYGLIAALSQLEVAKAKQALGVQPGGANEREDRLGSNQDIIQRAKDAETRKQLAEIQRANALAAADTAGKLELERDALARLNKGTVEYETQLGKVAAAERALQAEKDRNARKGGGAPRLTPNEKINTKLLDDQDKFNDKFEDAEQKHWDKVADIYEKFNAEQQKQFAKNEVSKRRSRADFYAGLQDAPAGVDTQKFAAQYEEAFTQAQQIAQSGRAKLANEFLELRQQQIEEMKQLDEEAAKIKEDEKEGTISEKDAADQLAFLEGRRKLIEDAQAEEQKLLLAQGDANVNALNEQLSAEEQAYNKQVDSIALSAERKADAVIKHAERSKIAVAAENKELIKQADYYDRIAKVNGGQVPSAQKASTTPVTTAAGDEEKPVTVEATSPIPVTTAEALIVRQAELFIVHDSDVMASIGDMAARLEGKLNEVVSAVNTAKQDISSAVNGVKDAVGRIKINTLSVVGA